MRFARRLNEAILHKGTPVCVGIDPAYKRMPAFFRSKYALDGENGNRFNPYSLLTEFGKLVIDAVSQYVPAVKPQAAYFERYGAEGLRALETVVTYAKESGLIVILDAKRGDIGETSASYAEAYLAPEGPYEGRIDCITLNPYLGPDSLEPFAEVAERNGAGIFVCVRTSNSGAAYLQNLVSEGQPIYAHVARLVAKFVDQQDTGDYSDFGAVVGATCDNEAQEIRRILPRSIFLVPGMGAQGGSLEVVRNCFDRVGMGALVNSSRAITFPEGDYTNFDGWIHSIRTATIGFVEDVQTCRRPRD